VSVNTCLRLSNGSCTECVPDNEYAHATKMVLSGSLP
jgi:uncharacterized membrane protein